MVESTLAKEVSLSQVPRLLYVAMLLTSWAASASRRLERRYLGVSRKGNTKRQR